MEKYEKPALEVILLGKDVITTSEATCELDLKPPCTPYEWCGLPD